MQNFTRETLKENSGQNVLFFFVFFFSWFLLPINCTYRLNTWHSRDLNGGQERGSEGGAIFVERLIANMAVKGWNLRKRQETCKWNRHLIPSGKFPTGKQDYFFLKFRFSRKISNGLHQKVFYYFTSQPEFFRKFVANGEQPLFPSNVWNSITQISTYDLEKNVLFNWRLL